MSHRLIIFVFPAIILLGLATACSLAGEIEETFYTPTMTPTIRQAVSALPTPMPAIVGARPTRLAMLSPLSTPTDIPLPTLAATNTRQPERQHTPTRTLTPIPTAFPPLPPIVPAFWTAVGVAPDTWVTLQIDNGHSDFGDIAVMHVDGSQLTQLTRYGYNLDPVLSPDRQRITYRSIPQSITTAEKSGLHEGYYNIWVIATDGTQAWQLTASVMKRSQPVWSPDSHKVAFSEGEGANSLLVESEVDTQVRRDLIRDAHAPRYRPDGSGIGYITGAGGLAWVDLAGATHTIIPTVTLPISTTILDFDWLPDGQHVIYTLLDRSKQVDHTSLGIKFSIWVVHIDGSEPTRLTEGGLHNVRVSPDGKNIAAYLGGGYYDACMINLQAAFLQLAPDLMSAQVNEIRHFAGHPNEGEMAAEAYPVSAITWLSPRLAFGKFAIACPRYPSQAGYYLMDPVERFMVQITH